MKTPRYDLPEPDPVQVDFFRRHWIPSIKTLADLGCGGGRYALHFASQGLEVDAYDRTPALLQEVKKRAALSGQKVRTAVIDFDGAGTRPFFQKVYDAILLIDVLEHVRDDASFLRRIKSSGKTFYVSVPRETPLALQEKGLCFGAYRDLTHRRYYDEARLEGLARKAGFKVRALEPMHPYVPQAFMPLLFDEKHLPSRVLSRFLYGRLRLVMYRRYWNSVAAVLEH